ncbi:hypothetical protein [Sporofaciens sp. SGI.106]|uniref:hypothetical protein n=1 Tax=Sporofaciens sp. SGI.106 TaxID=3420568 RepID=UPI003CFD37FD
MDLSIIEKSKKENVKSETGGFIDKIPSYDTIYVNPVREDQPIRETFLMIRVVFFI